MIECDICGRLASFEAEQVPFRWCESCNEEVMEDYGLTDEDLTVIEQHMFVGGIDVYSDEYYEWDWRNFL